MKPTTHSAALELLRLLSAPLMHIRGSTGSEEGRNRSTAPPRWNVAFLYNDVADDSINVALCCSSSQVNGIEGDNNNNNNDDVLKKIILDQETARSYGIYLFAFSTFPALRFLTSSSLVLDKTQGAFYKQFTRPFAKTMLIAVFTYQAVYWLWVKGETDEIRAEKDATIAGLEATIKAYDAKTKDTAERKSS
ncbi:hypothetical protein BGZ63DRAFT_424032 [Mariannaea sp. PMI_226]|nr:hypothetical protein BGZ63DRAFT_424032 [Mariannaea sp. PMI_226]